MHRADMFRIRCTVLVIPFQKGYYRTRKGAAEGNQIDQEVQAPSLQEQLKHLGF